MHEASKMRSLLPHSYGSDITIDLWQRMLCLSVRWRITPEGRLALNGGRPELINPFFWILWTCLNFFININCWRPHLLATKIFYHPGSFLLSIILKILVSMCQSWKEKKNILFYCENWVINIFYPHIQIYYFRDNIFHSSKTKIFLNLGFRFRI